jgi:hypothetical protein
MQVASWVSAILDLAADQAQRVSILRAASDTIHELLREAQNQHFEDTAAPQTDEVRAYFETFKPSAHRQSDAVNARWHTDEVSAPSQSTQHNQHSGQRNVS